MTARGEIFVVHGDITQITADAIAYSTSISVGTRFSGELYTSFEKNLPGVMAQWAEVKIRKGAGRQYFDFGESFWIPLETDHRPCGVVFVAAGGRLPQLMPEPPAHMAVVGAVREAVTHLRAREDALNQTQKRLLIALPAFRLGSGGSKNDDVATIRIALKAARQALDENPNVDVVFVSYTPRHYQMFLDARRELGLAPRAPDALMHPDLVDALTSAQCVLFVGAGLSKAAGMRDFKALIQLLAHDLGITGPLPEDVESWLDLAQWHREQFPEGPQSIYQIIQREFGTSNVKPTMDHYWLMSLPVHYVITTNYDSLLEQTLEAQRRYPNVAVTQEDVAQTGSQEGVNVVKFHGDAKHDQDELVLSRDDYDRFFMDRPVMAALLQGLLLNQTFFFVGYSLRDPNFRQIYSGITQMLNEAKRPAFATTFDPVTDYQKQQWRRKQVYLLPMKGSFEEQVHAERCFLDQLAERAAGKALFLAASSQKPQHQRVQLQRHLCAAGTDIENLVRHTMDWDEIQQCGDTLGFLSEMGWRPKDMSLAQLWLKLAYALDALPATDHRHIKLRRSLLFSALAHAENQQMADEIRSRIASLRS